MVSLHRIHRQRWQVRARDRAEAMRWRQSLREEGQQQLLAAMATVFDAFDQPDRAWHVPRLQLQLKVSSLTELHEQLPRALADALRDERRLLEIAAPTRQTVDISTGERRRSAVRHYLSTGQLDWQDAHGDRELRQQKLNVAPAIWRQLLREQLPSATDESAQWLMIWRWLQPLPAAARQTDVRALFTELAPDAAYQAQLTRLLDCLTEPTGATAFQQLQWLSLLVLRVWQYRQRQWQLPASLFGVDRPSASSEMAAPSQAQARLAPLQQWLQQPPLLQPTMASHASVNATAAAMPTAKPPSALLHQDFCEPFHQRLAMAAASVPVLPLATGASESPSVAVLHAGLVLLHPFLPQLFRTCELWQAGDKQLSMWLLPRAAALLHFLATGVDTIVEHECGAIKLLLGLAVDAPLPVAEGLLTETDREEADALLAAVIGHWAALKQTSASGLRLSFLQRPGLLRAEADGWRLHIEREAFDVLLDFLPWGIGVIKLPWMTDAIHTAW